MRRIAFTVLTFATVLGAAPLSGQDSRPGIAVLPFENGGSYGQDKEDFTALERGIAGMMISELSRNPGARLVDRSQTQRILDEQDLAKDGRVDAATAAKIGKLVGARYMLMGNFIDFYGKFRIDARIVDVETGEIIKVVSNDPRYSKRDDMFKMIQGVAIDVMADVKLPALPKEVAAASRTYTVPTEALTYYSRALLYSDRGDKQKAIEYYKRALQVFPEYAEAKEGLQRVQRS